MNTLMLMDQVLEIAELAAKVIMEVYHQDDFDTHFKSDRTPVTRADLLSHHLIVEKLQSMNPSLPVLSEEGAPVDWLQRRGWQTYWLIDPLDGTKEFVDKNDEFTVNIALIHQGEPIVGVVVAPALDVAYMAAKDIGAFKKEAGKKRTIKVRTVPSVNKQKHFSVIIGRRTRSSDIETLLRTLPAYEKIILGSSLKTCLIAEGKADLYPRFGCINEWDTAAAHCILHCAGGEVTDLALVPLRYNTKESLLNPDFIAFGDTEISWGKFLP